ncbi:MAG: S53 family peptidase [Janthinobacterium lividum]
MQSTQGFHMNRAARLAGALLATAAVTSVVAPGAAMAAIGTPAAASAPVQFEMFLPLQNTNDLKRLLDAQQTAGASYHKWVSPAEYAAQFGPTPAAWAAAKAAVAASGMQVTVTRARSMHITGTVAQAAALFATSLTNVTSADGKVRLVASGPLVMPAALASVGARVIAFSPVPPKHSFAQRSQAPIVDNRLSATGAYWYNDLKQAYDYPSYKMTLPNGQRLDGTGVSAAILMEDLLVPGDVDNFFNHEHFTTNSGKASNPKVTTVLIDGGGTVGGPGTFEASLDVQQVLGGAPGATVTLFSTPDLQDSSILDGYAAIVDSNKYDIVNSSFGECELFYTAAYNQGQDETATLQIYDEIFQQGNAQGITFVASSGDNGGKECTNVGYLYGQKTGNKFIAGVSTPAASTFVTAVGGGNLVTTFTPPRNTSLNSAYVSENAFGDPEGPSDPYGTGNPIEGGIWGAGGGKSTIFPKPSYQLLVSNGGNFRALPDVGMQVGGCPQSATSCGVDSDAIVAYDGTFYGVIGTSVSSPEFVGALVLFIQKTGQRVGNINTYLYHQGAIQTARGGLNAPAEFQYYHRNIPGYDGVYGDTYPTANYNYLVGNGTPDVSKLFGFTSLAGYAPAGIPQSPSNP